MVSLLFDQSNTSKFINNNNGLQQKPNRVLQKQISHCPMQELSLSVQERIRKTKEVVQQNLSSQTIRHLREQQKIRCEKQNFILAMMRSNKVITSGIKKSFYRLSYELMTLLEPTFEFKESKNLDEDFLNDFVHLYTSFFNHFETKFTFKTKIKNFLRPTNHNLIIDLIKYFVDFTRDYYVQTLFWKMRNSNKSEIMPASQVQQIQRTLEENNQDKISFKQKTFGICRNFSSFTEAQESSISPRKKTDDGQYLKSSQNIYEILEVSIPSFNISRQNLFNTESLKIKINELFREQKSRNSGNKKIYEQFYNEYYEKFKKGQNPAPPIPFVYPLKRSDKLNIKCSPLKLQLNVQKNGFSMILVQIEAKKIKNLHIPSLNKLSSISNTSPLNQSPLKSTQNNLSPLKIYQRMSQGQQVLKGDYFLTSMKVLRVSENFLPPIVASNLTMLNSETNSRKDKRQKEVRTSEGDKNEKEKIPFALKLKKMTDEMEEAVPLLNELSASSNVLIRSTSFKKSALQKQKQKLQNFNNQIYAGDYISHRQFSQHKGNRKDSEESYRVSNKKLKIKNRFIEERKSYQNGALFPSKNNHRQSYQNSHQSQEKILQWLQKIKNLKQIQRKKILGMNF